MPGPTKLLIVFASATALIVFVWVVIHYIFPSDSDPHTLVHKPVTDIFAPLPSLPTPPPPPTRPPLSDGKTYACPVDSELKVSQVCSETNCNTVEYNGEEMSMASDGAEFLLLSTYN